MKRLGPLTIMLMISSLLLACAGSTGSGGAMSDLGGAGGGGGGVNQAQPTITDANIVPEPIPVEDDEGPPSDFKAPEPEDDDGPNIPPGPDNLKSK